MPDSTRRTTGEQVPGHVNPGHTAEVYGHLAHTPENDAPLHESQEDVIRRLAPDCICPYDLCLGDSGERVICEPCHDLDPEWDCLHALIRDIPPVGCACGHPPADHDGAGACMHLCDCAWPIPSAVTEGES